MDDIVIRLQECAKRAKPTDSGEEYGVSVCLEAAKEIESCRRDAGFWEMFAKNRTDELEQSRKECNQLKANLADALSEAASWEQQASARTDDVVQFVQERDEWKKRAEAAEKDAAELKWKISDRTDVALNFRQQRDEWKDMAFAAEREAENFRKIFPIINILLYQIDSDDFMNSNGQSAKDLKSFIDLKLIESEIFP